MSELQVRIYPNPTIGTTTCILENILELGRFELVDQLGQIITSASLIDQKII